MKLQKKIESSLEDIIKTNKKTNKPKPAISNKSKVITRNNQKRQQLQRINKKPQRVQTIVVPVRKPQRNKTFNWAAGA